MYSTRPMMSPRGVPKATYKHKASAAAVAWWDNHVARTHLRNPPPTPGSMSMTSSLLSPRSSRGRGDAFGLNSSRPGSASPRRMGTSLLVDRLFDPNQGRLARHPLMKQLHELYKGFKFLDVDGDGFLSPTDIARGLRNFNLTAGSNHVSLDTTNELIARHMNVKGMVSYENFVHALAMNNTVCAEIAAAMEEKKANIAARRQRIRAAQPRGPQMRPGVTAAMLQEGSARSRRRC